MHELCPLSASIHFRNVVVVVVVVIVIRNSRGCCCGIPISLDKTRLRRMHMAAAAARFIRIALAWARWHRTHVRAVEDSLNSKHQDERKKVREKKGHGSSEKRIWNSLTFGLQNTNGKAFMYRKLNWEIVNFFRAHFFLCLRFIASERVLADSFRVWFRCK